MVKGIILIWTLLMMASCTNKSDQLSEEAYASFMLSGDSIATEAQTVLMQNVAAAIQQGGTEYAVNIGHPRARPITDGIADRMNVDIQRLSDKNRNPDNAIQSPLDSIAWLRIQSEKAHFIEQDKNGEVYYYKPISVAMPTCIKCHGSKADISESTQKVIAQKYPYDKAIGYEMGDLRGMWEIHWMGND